MDWGEELKDSWSTEKTEPPVPHAEEMTFSELAQIINKPVDGIMETLKVQNIFVQKDEIVKAAAARYGLSPMELFEKMKLVKKASSVSPYGGQGLGRKTLQEVCQTLQLNLNTSLQRLDQAGIQATAEMTLKDIAGKYGKTPVDIMEIINPQTTGK